MPRIPTIESRDQLPIEHQPIYDAITASRGHATGPWALLLNSPVLAQRTADLGAYLRFEGALDDKTRETVILTTARAVSCHYEWADHAPIARKVGVPEAVLEAIRDRRPAELPADLAPVVRYVQSLVEQHRVEEAEVASLEARFGVKGVLELTATVGYYTYLGTIMNAFDVRPTEPAEPLPD